MKHRIIRLTAVAAALCWLVGSDQPADACTGIRIKPKDGSVIAARTLEFAADLHSNVIVIPRAMDSVGTAPGDQPGLRWKSRYAIVGANAFDQPVIVDGLNEKGLGMGIFYFPGYAAYQEVKAKTSPRPSLPGSFPLFAGQFRRCGRGGRGRAARPCRQHGFRSDMGIVPPCHYVLHDAAGRCTVLEYVAGELKIHDNPLGVMTNSPTFDWHVTNLRNYVNLTVTNVPPIDLGGIRLSGLGQGSGMLGLPGDFTPPSRFVRAVAFSQAALPVATAREGVLQAFHLLNQFDIPKGAARGVENGRVVADYTLWTSASDLKNLHYHFRTFDNSRIRMIDLRNMDLDA